MKLNYYNKNCCTEIKMKYCKCFNLLILFFFYCLQLTVFLGVVKIGVPGRS